MSAINGDMHNFTENITPELSNIVTKSRFVELLRQILAHDARFPVLRDRGDIRTRFAHRPDAILPRGNDIQMTLFLARWENRKNIGMMNLVRGRIHQ
jgi:hypothetical protein